MTYCDCADRQKARYSDLPLPSEAYVSSVVMTHVSSLSGLSAHSVGLSLKHLLHCLVRLAESLFT